MASNNSRVIDLGAYGVAMSPALQNEPPYENDPRSLVTKIFYRKKDYDALREKKKRLSKILGTTEEGYTFQTYERQFRGRNLPPKVYRLLSNELSLNEHGNRPHNYTDTVFYPIRMSHLGIAVSSLKGKELLACDVLHVLTSIKKIYKTLATLAKHRTIHGDIHGGNILVYIEPPFCDMSLIDYDGFESYDEIKTAYHEGRDFMYGPPETYLLIQPHLRPPLQTNQTNQKNQEEKENGIIHAYASRFYYNDYVRMNYPTIQDMEKRLLDAIQAHGEKAIPFHHMDSFLLAPVLLGLLYRTYPFLKGDYSNVQPTEEKAIRKTKDILEQGFSFSSSHRLGPEETVQRLEHIICRLKNRNTDSDTNTHTKTKRNTEKNRNGCTVSGGSRRRNKTIKNRQKRGLNILPKNRIKWHR